MKTKNHNGKNYLVLERKKGSNTEKCPFCNTSHVHGNGDGHRIAHCSSDSKDLAFINNIQVFKKDGYFIETR